MFSKSEFMEANKDKKLNTLDYLHALFKFEDIHNDLLNSLGILFNPEFIIRDNKLFFEEVFNESKYCDFISEGRDDKEIQYWMNLIEITSIFEGMEVKEAKKFGSSIVEVWNDRIATRYSKMNVNASLIHDQITNEVFVTINFSD
ncbi:hypothetical protein TUM4438_46110 [Shewanella sairae]|uniref:Uncharacterized protein n=1 Tax=Shewanella sairae TaxID=190310 RepID=A0ABQ4PRZ1_9GAMM|nr:hypothetical protein [Shewanella sairae]MCL1132689.1 hypothetical protein [Shewanella sairae]GIU52731.1 hypothetical protein TUM4438_46110 [Shewanella sairae]